MDLSKFEEEFKKTDEYKAFEKKLADIENSVKKINAERSKLYQEKKRLEKLTPKIEHEQNVAMNEFIVEQLKKNSEPAILDMLKGESENSAEFDGSSFKISADSSETVEKNSAENSDNDVKKSTSEFQNALNKKIDDGLNRK